MTQGLRAPGAALMTIFALICGCDQSAPPPAPGAGKARPARQPEAALAGPSEAAGQTLPTAGVENSDRRSAASAPASAPTPRGFVHPLLDAQRGEYTVTESAGGVTTRTTVVQTTGDSVTLRFASAVPGRRGYVVSHQTISLRPKSLASLASFPQGEPVGEEVLTVAGRPVRCAIYQTEQAGVVRQMWISHEVPVFGVAKVVLVRAGRAVVAEQVTDFGWAR